MLKRVVCSIIFVFFYFQDYFINREFRRTAFIQNRNLESNECIISTEYFTEYKVFVSFGEKKTNI